MSELQPLRHRLLSLTNGTVVDPDGDPGVLIHAIAQSEAEAVARALAAEVKVGPAKLDALRAIDNYQRTGEFADAWLIRHGYAPKQADRLLERIMDGRLAECGVSTRTGWLEPLGRSILERAEPRE